MFFVTTLHDKDIHSTRCVGYYKTLKDAKQCVEENWGHISEFDYKFAVIEEFPDGIYPHTISEHWYKLVIKDDRYVECGKPEIYKNTVGFGIG